MLPTPPRTERKSKMINIHPEVSAMDIAAFADVPASPLPSLSSGSPQSKISQMDFGMLESGFEDFSSPSKASSSAPRSASSTKERANSLAERVSVLS